MFFQYKLFEQLYCHIGLCQSPSAAEFGDSLMYMSERCWKYWRNSFLWRNGFS